MRKIFILLSLTVLAASCAVNNYPIISKSAFYPAMYQSKPVTVLIMPVINRTAKAVDADYITSSNAVLLSERGFYVMPSSIIHNIIKQDSLECLPDVNPAPCAVFHERFGVDALLFIAVKNWDKSFQTSTLFEEFEYSLVDARTGKELWYYDIFFSKNREVPMSATQPENADFCTSMCCGIFGSIFTSAVATALTSYNLTAEQAGEFALQSLPAGKYNSRYMLDAHDQVKVIDAWKNQGFGNRMAVENHN